MCKRDAPMSVRICLWPLRRDDSSRVLIGAAWTCRSDWRMRDVGVVIGQGGCRLLALAQEAIDSTRAGASGSLHSATTNPHYTTVINLNIWAILNLISPR